MLRPPRRATTVALLAVVAGALAPVPPPAAEAAPTAARAAATRPTTAPRTTPTQWRSLWVDAFNDGIGSPAQVKRLVADAKSAGVNVLVVQVARRYDCACNSSRFPRISGVAPTSYDPLAEVVKQGHAAGLQVHAWVNATTLWSWSTPPQDPRHVYNTHGFTATGANRWLDRRVDGAERDSENVYIDPANPAAVGYFADGVASIQRRYAVDGINLDYIRYPDPAGDDHVNDWGYTQVALQRFRAETGRTDTPRPADPQWSQWRRNQVTGMVRQVRTQMLKQDKRDRLSVNAVTYGYGPTTAAGFRQTRPYAGVLQDFQGWMRSGLIDSVVAMNYKRGWDPAQARMYSTWVTALARMQKETRRQVVSGGGLYLNPTAVNVAQAKEATRAGLGWSGYAYSEPSQASATTPGETLRRQEFSALATGLRRSVFVAPARVPGVPARS